MYAQPTPYGMDIHASIHAAEEEFSIMQAANVFVQLEIGMEPHVLSVLILKFGADQDLHVFAQPETGMVLLVLNAQPIKSGSLPL